MPGASAQLRQSRFARRHPRTAHSEPWLGCISQALVTKEGPIANWSAHVADPVHVNLLAPGYCKDFGLYCVAY